MNFRQMLESKNDLNEAKGKKPSDLVAEFQNILAEFKKN